MLNVDVSPQRRISLRPESTLELSDRRRSSFKDDLNLPRTLGSRPSVSGTFAGSRRVSIRSSHFSTDSVEMSDYRGSFSIYKNDENDSLDMDGKGIGNENAVEGSGTADELGRTDQKDQPHLYEESYIYRMIPSLPLAAALPCLMLNIILPGMGTIFSGIFNICHNGIGAKSAAVQSRNSAYKDPASVLCINFWVGICQFSTVTFLLVGWFWSLAWGIYLVNISLDNRQKKKMKKNAAIQKKAIHVLLTDSGAGGAIRSGMLGIHSMIQNQKKHFGVDDCVGPE